MNSVKELLTHPSKGTDKAQGILCYLFRHVLLWGPSQMTQITWNRRLNQYFEKPHNKTKPVDKGNLNKTLIARDLTWGSFKKAIDFLNPVAATFTITLEWRNGRVSEFIIPLDPAEDESDPALNSFDVKESNVFDNIKKPANTLARLFRQIVREENIDLLKWNQLFEAWAKAPENGVAQNPRDITSAISTLQRSVLDTRMTWNVFRKGILVLNPLREEYKLTCHWTNNPTMIRLDPDKATTVHVAGFRDPFATGRTHDRTE